MNLRLFRRGLFLLLGSPALLATAQPFSEPSPEAAAYATFGIVIAQNVRLDELRLSDAQFEAFVDGLRRYRLKHPPPSLNSEAETILEDIRQRVNRLQQTPDAAASTPQDPLRAYLSSARERLNLQENESGLLHRILTGSVGPRPRAIDTVVIDIAAKAPDMSTDLPQLSRNDARIKVSDLLPGIAEGVQMLTLGGSQLLVLPPHLSFGQNPWPEGLQPGMPLVFQITLKEIVSATDPVQQR